MKLAHIPPPKATGKPENNVSIKFSDPGRESAVVGYTVSRGFDLVPRSELPDPDDFTHAIWKPLYGAAHQIHLTGRPVNHLTITDEVVARGWDKDLKKEFRGRSWKGWHRHADASLVLCDDGSSIRDACKDIRRLAGERRGHAIIAKAHAGQLNVEETIEALQAIGQNGARGLPPIILAKNLCAKPPPTPPEIIEGILHQGSKMALGGGSKSFKTWALLQLAICVATGSEWLGFPTTAGRVLYVNFELPDFAIEKRIHAICDAMEIETPENLALWNLRGHAADAAVILPQIARSAKGYALIILDPLYKLLGDREENAAGGMANLMNSVERLAVDTSGAAAYGLHFAKGNASGKESMDRISGSGVFARDPDSIVTMTQHEQDKCFSVEMTLRNFPPQEPFVVRRQHPLMVVDGKLNPEDLKKPKGRDPVYDKEDLLKCLKGGMTTTEWKEASGIPPTTFYRLRKQLLAEGRIFLSELDKKWSHKP